MATPQASDRTESNWPGERIPSRDDVRDAIKVPDHTFLDRYKTTLLASSDALHPEDLMSDVEITKPLSNTYTYPLAMLEGLPPSLPQTTEPQFTREVFLRIFAEQTFLRNLPIPGPTTDNIVAPLRFAVATLSSLHDRRDEEESREGFLLTSGLWGTIMETDNREARSVELLVAATLATSYGAVSSDDAVQRRSNLLLCSSMTIARRMQLDTTVDASSRNPATRGAYGGNIMWSLWILDILHALHFNGTVMTFTTRELRTAMPGSNLAFQGVYHALLDANTTEPNIEISRSSQEDALLLLMAILSDVIYIRGSLGHAISAESLGSEHLPRRNPHIPFSAPSELIRMEQKLSQALTRWHDHFLEHATPKNRAFYYYCTIYSSCRQLQRLVDSVGSTSKGLPSDLKRPGTLSDRDVRAAWLILDNVSEWQQNRSAETICPIWFPVMVYHAAVVVWAQQWCSEASSGISFRSSKRILVPFKIELGQMHWPCCKHMVKALDRL